MSQSDKKKILNIRISESIDAALELDDESQIILDQRLIMIGSTVLLGDLLSLDSNFMEETKTMLETRNACEKLKLKISESINEIF